MMIEKAIFKIGGALLENPAYLNNVLSQLNQLVKESIINTIIIIPGGGSYANFIRELDIELKIGDTLAHWMALYAMDYNGKHISQQCPFLHLTDTFEDLQTNNHVLYLFLPLKHIKASDPLPHSWNVTSDSITLYLAHELQLEQCFLIKDVDGILTKDNEVVQNLTTTIYTQMKESGKLAKIKSNQNQIKQSKPIDDYILTIIESLKMSCILINGGVKDSRIYHYFTSTNENEKIFTKISFS